MSGNPAILVKAPNWIGDCVMATPSLALLRRALPDAGVDILARPGVADVLADNPDINNLIRADERSISTEAMQQLVSAKYDAAVILPNSYGAAQFIRKLKIPIRTGFKRNWRGVLLTDRIAFNPKEWQTATPQPISRKSIPENPDAASPPRHMVEYYLEIARRTITALGAHSPDGFDPVLRVHVSDEADGKVRELLSSAGLDGTKLVGVNPGAAYGGAKRWPLEYLGAVVKELSAMGCRVVSTAGPRERSLNDELEIQAGTPIQRIGEMIDVRGLIALIARLQILITNDSGAMHIAAALNVPTVSIFGPTDWEVTRPFSHRSEIMRNSPPCAPCFLRECPIDHRCMRSVTPEEVMAAAREAIQPSEAQVV